MPSIAETRRIAIAGVLGGVLGGVAGAAAVDQLHRSNPAIASTSDTQPLVTPRAVTEQALGQQPLVTPRAVTEQAPATVRPTLAAEFDQADGQLCETVSVPASLEDPDMISAPLWEAPENEWFHRVFKPELFNQENNWGGADSWGVSLMGNFTNAHWEEFGNPGEVRIQVNEGASDATLRVGAMTSERYINDYKWGTRGGERTQMPNKKIGMWIRTQPGAEITVCDPDTGRAYKDGDGNALTVTANDRGDAGIILPNNGRVEAVWRVTDPTKGSFETIAWFGPDDDPKSDERINKVDASEVAVKPAL